MIKLFHGGFENKLEIPYTKFNFPGGELQVRLNPDEHWNSDNLYTILWHYENDAELMEIALIRDALLEAAGVELENGDKELGVWLDMPYLPYARQDRVCSRGEAFALRVFAGLVNSLNFDIVRVTDPHNQEAFEEYFDNFWSVPQGGVALYSLPFTLLDQLDVILFPDAGSTKKIEQYKGLALDYSWAIAQGSKLRDPHTGSLTGFDINVKDFRGKNVLIVDDICDGGGTFIGLANVAKSRNCGKLYLYTTHGIYSKGMDALNQSFDGVYCYNNMFERNFKLPQTVN